MKLIKQIKEAKQDFEFYPTTSEIIDRMKSALPYQWRNGHHYTILDIGAGHGRVLSALPADKKMAIEKSEILAGLLPPDVLFVGSKFEEQTLFEIEADLTFCNPPYSEYVDWTVKILEESRSEEIFLVIPERWKDNPRIQAAIERRSCQVESLGSFDFLEADRKARAYVNLLQITTKTENCDRFQAFVEEQFPKPSQPTEEEIEFRKHRANLSTGEDYLERLVSCYNQERDRMQKTYMAVLELDYTLLKSLEIDSQKLALVIQTKLQGLRDGYWREIFDRLDSLNDRFTESNKRKFISTLLSNTHIEFTVENIRMIAQWMVGQANHLMDSQLVEVWERMISLCNVKAYKSNERTFSKDEWRFKNEDNATHYSLELRIVAHYCGGINQEWEYHNRNGINDRCEDFLSDLRVAAINLGYTNPTKLGELDEWTSGKRQYIYADNKGKRQVIAEIKAFKNQNLHIKFARRFLCSLNVEYGKIKGWLLSGPQAAKELGEPLALEVFKESHRIGMSAFPLLGCPEEVKEPSLEPDPEPKAQPKKKTPKKPKEKQEPSMKEALALIDEMMLPG